MTKIGSSSPAHDLFLGQLKDLQKGSGLNLQVSDQGTKKPGASFMDHLAEGIKEVDAMQKQSDRMAVDVASGKSENLHETMLAASEAELSFNLMVQVRNKILEAYQEILRMPV